MNREFLMLAHEYNPAKHGVAGWFMSEKLDGVRAFWDGGVSRGMMSSNVPYANTAKDARLNDIPIATGLWSRYGKVIHAPDWFLDQLPTYPLDGELYMGRGRFQDTVSAVKTHIPIDIAWQDVVYHIFDMPHISLVLQDGRINNPNLQKHLSECLTWYQQTCKEIQPKKTLFEDAYNYLCDKLPRSNNLKLHYQLQLPFSNKAIDEINQALDQVTSNGGEGLMLRKHYSMWTPHRSHDLLKVKKLHDMEGTVVGYTAGKATDKGSKLLGLMGSVRLRLDSGLEFDLSGFTDEEREMEMIDKISSARAYLSKIPGERINEMICINPKFPPGTKLTFRFREMTNDNLPKEARFLRKAV